MTLERRRRVRARHSGAPPDDEVGNRISGPTGVRGTVLLQLLEPPVVMHIW